MLLLALSLSIVYGRLTVPVTIVHDKTLQELINEAPPGSIIYIQEGVYKERLIVNKSISLVGKNPTNTIVSGGGTGEVIKVLADNVSIYNLTLCDAEQAITLYKVKNCKVDGCIIRNILMFPGVGIYAFDCKNITVENNRFESIYADNILFRQVEKSVIKRNVFNANKRLSQSISLENSSQNVIELNLISGQGVINEGGIGLLYSNGNIIQYNTILENDWAGVSLRYSNSCIIRGNTILGHTWYGLKMSQTNNNSIYWNNFISNYRHVQAENSENITWYLENFGNYWDNYLGTDLDMNGIGDKPHQIDRENFDFHPLMGKFYRFTVLDANNIEDEVFIISNSTIENLSLIKTSEFTSIALNVLGVQNTIGFCLAKFSRNLIQPPCEVKVDDYAPIISVDYSSNDYTILYFAYFHQDHANITIISEISVSTVNTVMACTLVLTSLVFRKKSLTRER